MDIDTAITGILEKRQREIAAIEREKAAALAAQRMVRLERFRETAESVLGADFLQELGGLWGTDEGRPCYSFPYRDVEFTICESSAINNVRIFGPGNWRDVSNKDGVLLFLADNQPRERETVDTSQDDGIRRLINSYIRRIAEKGWTWPRKASINLMKILWEDPTGHHDGWALGTEEIMRQEAIYVTLQPQLESAETVPLTYSPTRQVYYLWAHKPIGYLQVAHALTELPAELVEPIRLALHGVDRVQSGRDTIFIRKEGAVATVPIGVQPLEWIRNTLGGVGCATLCDAWIEQEEQESP